MEEVKQAISLAECCAEPEFQEAEPKPQFNPRGQHLPTFYVASAGKWNTVTTLLKWLKALSVDASVEVM